MTATASSREKRRRGRAVQPERARLDRALSGHRQGALKPSLRQRASRRRDRLRAAVRPHLVQIAAGAYRHGSSCLPLLPVRSRCRSTARIGGQSRCSSERAAASVAEREEPARLAGLFRSRAAALAAEFYQQACGAGLEGVVSKRADSTYVSGRTKSWLKTKCHQRAELVIGGYSRSSVRGRPFSSLLLGTFENGELIYAGKVGTGFSQRRPRRARQALQAARAEAVVLCRGAGDRAQGRGVAQAEARLRGGIYRMDARRPLAPSKLSGLARRQAGG